MAFLTLNGLTIPVAKGGEVQPLEIGSHQRAFDGALLRERRAIKRQWRFETTPQQASAAAMLRDIILGRGLHWEYDTDAISVGGLPPSIEAATQFLSNTAADGNAVANIYTAPSTEDNVAARAGAVAIWDQTTNSLPAVQRDAEGTPSADYTALGAAVISTNTTEYWQGTQSAKVTTTGAGDGIRCALIGGYSGGQSVTGSVYVYTDGSTTVKLTVEDNLAGLTALNHTPDSTGWHRCSVTHVVTAGASTVFFKVEQVGAGAKVWSCDGFQQETNALVSAWYDGTRTGDTRIQYGANAVAMFAGARGATMSFWSNGSDSPSAYSQDGYLAHLLLGSATTADSLSAYFRIADGKFSASHVDAAGANTTVVATTSTAGWGPWHHYVVTADFGAGMLNIYIDGAAEGNASISATSLADLGNGGLEVGRLGNGASATVLQGELDRLLLLPYPVTADWVTAEYAGGTAPAYDPQRPTMSGDVIQGLTATVMGRVNRAAFRGVQRAGTWEANNVVLDFELMEV